MEVRTCNIDFLYNMIFQYTIKCVQYTVLEKLLWIYEIFGIFT
jgi:hypothetical protein